MNYAQRLRARAWEQYCEKQPSSPLVQATPIEFVNMDEYERLCPVNPVTGYRYPLLESLVQNPSLTNLAMAWLKTAATNDIYSGLTDEDMVKYAPSRFDNTFAGLDEYSEHLAKLYSELPTVEVEQLKKE